MGISIIHGRKFQLLVKKIMNTKGYTLLIHQEQQIRNVEKRRIPNGCFPIYVGEELKRYVVPVAYLSSKRMQDLLNKFEDEIQGVEPIVLPCSVHFFEEVLDLIEADKKKCGRYI